MRKLFGRSRAGCLLLCAPMALGGELHPGRAVADQTQQFEPGAVTGSEGRLSAAGQGLQDLQFVRRYARRFHGHGRRNAPLGITLPKFAQGSA
jgi:hypothetical protein